MKEELTKEQIIEEYRAYQNEYKGWKRGFVQGTLITAGTSILVGIVIRLITLHV